MGERAITFSRRPSTLAAFTFALVALAAALLIAPGAASAKKAKYDVEVTRDKAGIPHVDAGNFLSLGYGQGYSYAQDNLCLFADAITTVRGERTKYFGADGFSYYYSNSTVDPNPKSDGFWKWVQAAKLTKGVDKGFSKNAKDLFKGWVAGYNAYLKKNKVKDPACKGEPWVKPISYDDLLLRGLQIEIGASSGRFISGLYDAQPPTGGGNADSEELGAPDGTDVADADLDIPSLRDQVGDLAGESDLGSNGLAFGKDATKKKGGVLLANPHFPWRGIDRFWMAHLEVDGKYDVMGGALGGLPLIGVGFNDSMAWTHTVSTGRRFIVRQLQLAPGDPTSYIVDGQTIPMTRTTVDINGTPHTYYGTEFGLVANVPDAGYLWTDSTAYVLTDANLDNTNVVDQYLKMGQADSVKDLLKVEKKGRAVPFFNTIATDSKGNAMYADVGRYSNVPKSLIDTCTPAGTPTIVYQAARVITLDGSKSSCTPDGLLPADQMPTITRKDYVENSNDSYWLANPNAPITGITPLIGLEGTQQAFRTRQGNLMVQDALNNGTKFNVPKLQKLWENDRSYQGELLGSQVVSMCQANPSITIPDGRTVDVTEACPIIQSWDRTGNLDSKGAWLWVAFSRYAPTGASAFTDAFDPNNPLTTPSQLNTSNTSVVQALGRAVQELRDNGIPLDSSLRGVQVATRGSKRISIHGCGQCFQNINSSNGSTAANAPYGEVIQGSSIVLTTELTNKGPNAEGILTYSQATDPTSPYFANMTKMFSKKKWASLAYTDEQIAEAPKGTKVKLPNAG